MVKLRLTLVGFYLTPTHGLWTEKKNTLSLDIKILLKVLQKHNPILKLIHLASIY